MAKLKTSYKKQREVVDGELKQLKELVHHLQERLPREPQKQKKHLRLGLQSSVMEEAKDIQTLAKKTLKDSNKFMESMSLEHSEAFVTPQMERYLKRCENLIRDLPWTIDKSPKPVQQIIGKDCKDLVDSLKRDVTLIKEERLTAESQQVKWSIY